MHNRTWWNDVKKWYDEWFPKEYVYRDTTGVRPSYDSIVLVIQEEFNDTQIDAVVLYHVCDFTDYSGDLKNRS